MKGTVCMHNWKSKVCHDGRKLCTMGIVLMLAASCCVSSFSLEYPGTVHLCLLWAGEAGLGRKTCLVLLCNEKPQLPPVRRTRRFRQPHGLMQVCIKCRTCPGSTGWDCLPKSLASGCSKVSCCLFFFFSLLFSWLGETPGLTPLALVGNDGPVASHEASSSSCLALDGHSGARNPPAFASHHFHGFLAHLYTAEVCLGVSLDISASRVFTLAEFASPCPAGWRKWGCTGKPQHTCQLFWVLSSQSQLPFSTNVLSKGC